MRPTRLLVLLCALCASVAIPLPAQIPHSTSLRAPCSTPAFNPSGGTYSSTQNVTMSCAANPFAVIYYTANGATPTHASTVYSGAVEVAATTTLKAICALPYLPDSAVQSQTYTINGSSAFASDLFTDANGTNLTAHVPTVGTSWTKNTNCTSTAAEIKINNNTAYASDYGPDMMFWYVGATSSGADYSVTAVLTTYSGYVTPGPAGRISTTACTGYGVQWLSSMVALYKYVAGDRTYLGTWDSTMDGTPTTFKLEMIGAAIKVYIAGTLRISVTDSEITAAGRAGIFQRGADTYNTLYLDNWVAQ